MTWPLFAVLQLGCFALAAVAALWLHNSRLRRRNEELLDLCLATEGALASLTARFEKQNTMVLPEQLLKERLKMLTDDSPVTRVRRLVIENEIKAVDGFTEKLADQLASAAPEDPEAADFARRWRAVREECQQLAMFLIAANPACFEPIEELFSVFASLDEHYGVKLEPLQRPPVGDDGDATPEGTQAQDEGSDDEAEELDQEALDELLAAADSSSPG